MGGTGAGVVLGVGAGCRGAGGVGCGCGCVGSGVGCGAGLGLCGLASFATGGVVPPGWIGPATGRCRLIHACGRLLTYLLTLDISFVTLCL